MHSGTIGLPKVKLDFARKSFYFLGASAFDSYPLKIKQLAVGYYLGSLLYSVVNKLRSHS